ncbi:MAG: 23S rRNA (pseudouridine(1915)-N(3))-methyltransferase RlmH [Nitrospirota bacterium]
MKIAVLCVGKAREAWVREAQEKYRKFLSPFLPVEIVEIPEEKLSDPGRPEGALKKEAARIAARLKEGSRLVLLDAGGRSFDSRKFAGWLEKRLGEGKPLAFLVGSATGVADEVRARADEAISLSPLTFPHDLARIVLLEQLYRAMTILRGKMYHY